MIRYRSFEAQLHPEGRTCAIPPHGTPSDTARDTRTSGTACHWIDAQEPAQSRAIPAGDHVVEAAVRFKEAALPAVGRWRAGGTGELAEGVILRGRDDRTCGIDGVGHVAVAVTTQMHRTRWADDPSLDVLVVPFELTSRNCSTGSNMNSGSRWVLRAKAVEEPHLDHVVPKSGHVGTIGIASKQIDKAARPNLNTAQPNIPSSCSTGSNICDFSGANRTPSLGSRCQTANIAPRHDAAAQPAFRP